MTRPSETLLDAYRRQLQDEPSHGPGTFRYPRARSRKVADVPPGEVVEGIIGGETPGGAGLVSRVWGWLLQTAGANTRSTVVSPGFTTPCMLYQVNYNWPQAASGAGALSLFYGTDNSGGQVGGAVANKPSGTQILQPASFAAPALTETDTISEHIPIVGEGGTVTQPTLLTPRYIIESGGRVFFKVSLGGAAAADTRVRGVLTIYEAGSVAELVALG